MIRARTNQVLQKLLEATQCQALKWRKDPHGDWYTASFDDREVSVRFLYFEATNQVGADRHVIQLSMPGLSGFFASGTEGYFSLIEILAAAFDEFRSATENCGEHALSFLEEAIKHAENS